MFRITRNTLRKFSFSELLILAAINLEDKKRTDVIRVDGEMRVLGKNEAMREMIRKDKSL